MGVCPDEFEQRMRVHWQSLGNECSDALGRSWHTTATIFNRVADGLERNRWNVLALPTGTGKTQSVAIYCSMLPKNEELGVLIVTPLKLQATEIADQINELAGDSRAIANHTDSSVGVSAMQHASVLAITHSAYAGSIPMGEGGLARSNAVRFENWSGGTRRLTIIDETPPTFRPYSTTLQDLAHLHGTILGLTAPNQVSRIPALNALIQGLKEVRATNDGRERFLERKVLALFGQVDFAGIYDGLATDDVSEFQFGGVDGIKGSEVRKQCRSILRNLSNIERIGWAWISQKGSIVSVHASEAVLPKEHGGGVILDATANVDLTYELLGDQAVVVPIEPNLRRYGNLSLKIASNQRVGKEYLTKNIRSVWPSVVRGLAKELRTESKILVCCHKDVEPYVRSHATKFSELEVTHWGAINGRNDWSIFDTIVILGLPYLNPIVAADAFMALQGKTNDDWLQSRQSRKFGNHTNIREAYDIGYITKSVIQAVGRVRCRRTIDRAGNCAPTNIFMLLPSGLVGDSITSAMENNMTGIQVNPWHTDLTTRRVRPSHARQALAHFLMYASPGIYTKKLLGRQGFSKTTLDRLIHTLKDKSSPNSLALRELRIEYVSPQRGRGFEAHFVKAESSAAAICSPPPRTFTPAEALVALGLSPA